MKTTTHNQVIDYLQWTTEEYEERILIAMFHWCKIHGNFDSVIQQMLANATINKWFLHEYEKCEATFLKIAEQIPNNTKQLEVHYKACTADVNMIYCKPLLNGIKRNPEFSEQYLNNCQPIYFN